MINWIAMKGGTTLPRLLDAEGGNTATCPWLRFVRDADAGSSRSGTRRLAFSPNPARSGPRPHVELRLRHGTQRSIPDTSRYNLH